jgi:branched-chain amino acid transport system substrate-binding protein
MKQAASMKDYKIDTLLPGITVTTSDVDYAPLQAVQLQRFDGQQYELFGQVLRSDK